MSKTQKPKKASFNLTMPENMPQIYADDLCHMMLGMPNSRLVFHVTPAIPKQGETAPSNHDRLGVLQLTIPTAALFNLAKHILSAAHENEEQIARSHERYGEFCRTALNGISVKDPDTTLETD